MNQNPYIKQYQKVQIDTASPEKILIMLYSGAITFLKKAKNDFAEDNKIEAHNNVLAAEKIILEFMETLDMEVGGEMAKNLYSLYDYLYNRLVQCNLNNEAHLLDEVIMHLEKLKDTWIQAIQIANNEKSADDTEE